MGTRRGMLVAATSVASLVVASCMSGGVVQVSADTYRISRADSGARYPDAAAMKAAVVSEADEFARRQGKVVVPVSTHEETMRVGHLSTIDYEFRLAAPGEVLPVAAAAPSKPVEPAPRPETAPRSEAAVDQSPARAADAPQSGKSESISDLYTELLKLDDLRKRGILTEDEFQALKKKVIAGK